MVKQGSTSCFTIKYNGNSALDFDSSHNFDGAYTFFKKGRHHNLEKAISDLASVGLALTNKTASGNVESYDIEPIDESDPRYNSERCDHCGEETDRLHDLEGDQVCEECRDADRTCSECNRVENSPRALIDMGDGDQLCETCDREKHPENWKPKK